MKYPLDFRKKVLFNCIEFKFLSLNNLMQYLKLKRDESEKSSEQKKYLRLSHSFCKILEIILMYFHSNKTFSQNLCLKASLYLT